MIKPKVTVILLSYNHQNYLGKSIESVLKQTYKNLNLIISDDGSTDSSPNIIKSYNNLPNVAIDIHENYGIAGNINYSVNKYANSEYLCFIASDDYWPSDRIEKQVDFMQKNRDYGFCYGKYYTIDINDKIIGSSSEINYSGYIFDKLFSRTFSLPTPTILYKTDALKSVCPIPKNIHTEDLFLHLMVSKSYKGGFINEYLSYYRKHSYNLSKRSFQMYLGHKYVLSLFSNDPLYHKCIKLHHLRWFSQLAKDYKKYSLKYIISASKYYYKKEFWVGIFRLINLHK